MSSRKLASASFAAKVSPRAGPGGGTLAGIAAIAVIMCVTLVPFLDFKEIRRAYGEAGFDGLIFRDGSA